MAPAPTAASAPPKKRPFDVWRLVKAVVFVVALIPFAYYAQGIFTDTLGANPIEAIIRGTGDWAIRFLIASLAITPVRRLTGLNDLQRFRRMIGLYAFFYVCVHLLAYVALDNFFDFATIWTDIVKRPYITIGMAAFVLLIPLAVTSTNGMIKRLGGRRWMKLHKLAYPIGIAGVVHYYLLVKADIRDPLMYAAILAVALGYRVVVALRKRKTSASPTPRRSPAAS